MKKFAKIFESSKYGQILVTRKTLTPSEPSDYVVTIFYLKGTGIMNLQLAPNRRSPEGLEDLFISLNLVQTEKYINDLTSKKPEIPKGDNVHYLISH